MKSCSLNVAARIQEAHEAGMSGPNVANLMVISPVLVVLTPLQNG
jgi:hypothetical protein